MSDHLIVIPVFDEAPTLGGVVSRARRHGAVLVVDDGSSDGSGAVASAAGADVIRLGRRRGKGEALRQGWRAAIERGVDRVVTLDGDGQHDPDDIPRLLKAASDNPGAIVIGNRLGGGGARLMTPGRLAALRVAGFFIDWLTGIGVADTQSGFRVYPARLLQTVAPHHGGFVLETEILTRATEERWRIVEVPVTSVDVNARPSRFRPARDGIAVGTYLAGRVVRRWRTELGVVAAALARPLTAERRRLRHRAQAAFAAPHRHNPAAWALAIGVFTLDCIATTWSGWLRDPRARCLAQVGLATAATPVLLALALVHALATRWGLDALTAFTRRIYDQDGLARLLPQREASLAPSTAKGRVPDHDVLVVGGGPGGATAAALLARGGLSVALVEREVSPRLRVGESMLPANPPLLDRLGVLDRIRERGVVTKHGASFHDQESDLEYKISFREGKAWPPYSFEVPRAELDQILRDNAGREPRVTLLPPAAVDEVRFDSDGVSARVSAGGAAREVRARFLVDAGERDAVAASRMSGRPPRPGLGKLALFAHFRGAQRWPGRDEGTSRIFVFEDGWFWWIPFARDLTSVGCVLHARTARECAGPPNEVFDAMIRRCRRVRDGLDKAVRLTEVYSAANISPGVERAVGDRFLCVGGAPAFADPIFSSSAYVSMRLAELAAGEILRAFRDDCLEASRFAGHLRCFDGWRSLFGLLDSVTGALAGRAFAHAPLRMRLSLQWFFAIVRVNRWRRGRRHRPVESRLPW